MDPTIITALIALIGTIFSGFIGVYSANKVVGVKIEELQKKVEKHNSTIERTYRLETKMALVEADIEDIKEELHERNN